MQKLYELFNGHLVHVYFYAAPTTPPLPPTTPQHAQFRKIDDNETILPVCFEYLEPIDIEYFRYPAVFLCFVLVFCLIFFRGETLENTNIWLHTCWNNIAFQY